MPRSRSSPIDLRETGESASVSFRYYRKDKDESYTHLLSYMHEGKTFDCDSRLVSDLLASEYRFRVYIQDKEARVEFPETENRFGRDADGAYCSDDEFSDSSYCNASVKKKLSYLEPAPVIARSVKFEKRLYHCESALPWNPLRQIYEATHEDDIWYLRDELVMDCIWRGGCCGRECGCCEKRLVNLPRMGTNGHCTLGCGCCQERNDFYPTIRQLEESIQQEKEALESDNPFHLLRMADAYFSKPTDLPSSQLQTQLEMVSASTDWEILPDGSFSSDRDGSWDSGSMVTITEDRVAIEQEAVEREISASNMIQGNGEEKPGLWSRVFSGRK